MLVRCPHHPQAHANGYVAEHRLVLEAVLGRYLLPGEKVVHRNGDRSDNRPENLELVSPPPPAERFWGNVARGAACWLWQGGRSRQGYGVFSIDARTLLAHRVAYALRFGPIPEGLVICHRCDMPPCVNPAHLFAGTQRDNMADMRAKGRGRARLSAADLEEVRRLQQAGLTQQAVAARLGVHEATIHRAAPVGGPQGERNPKAKLTAAEVRTLRWRAWAGEGTGALARAYGVSVLTIQRIVTGKRWGHLSWFDPADVQAALSDDVRPLFPEGR